MKKPISSLLGKSERGFTIIESLLFLSISGIMLVGVLVVVSGSIERQRYNDAVYSTVDYLKLQYSFSSNVHNNRSKSTNCGVSGIDLEASNGTSRGTSDCFLVGRIIRSNSDSTLFTSQPIVSTVDADDIKLSPTANEKDLLLAMKLKVDDGTDTDKFSIPYEVSVVGQKTDDPAPFSLLIVRLPTSELVRTYFVSGANTEQMSVDEIVSGSKDNEVCFNSQGLVKSARNGMKVTVSVSGSSAIEYSPGDNC